MISIHTLREFINRAHAAEDAIHLIMKEKVMRSAIQDVKPRRGPTPQLIDGITKSEHRQKLHGEVTTTLAELRASRTAAKTGALSLMYVTKAKDKEAIARHKEA